MSYNEDYRVSVPIRTVVKTTAAVCFTIFACRVAGQVATPYIRELNNQLERIVENLKEPVVAVPVEVPTTVDE